MIGIIGGTGLYQLNDLKNVEMKKLDTPFGSPSGPLTMGHWGETPLVFLPRHGVHHELLPSEINFRANIWAMKSVGVTQLLSVSAVGSLEIQTEPGDLAIPDQYIDLTKGIRERTFFGDGIVAYVSTAQPTCPHLSSFLLRQNQIQSENQPLRIHAKKTYACVEGPRLGTKAESVFLKNAGAHLVGMTNVPEVFLAREAQICYCTIAVVTDYDCWLEDSSQHASVEKVMALYKKNIERVRHLLQIVTQDIHNDNKQKNNIKSNNSDKNNSECLCRESLKFSILTSESNLSKENKKILETLRR